MKTRVWSQRKWISNRIKHTRSQKRERESQCCLSGEEISLKARIRRVSIRKPYLNIRPIHLNWERQDVKTSVFNHFQEIRYQTDEQREELKEEAKLIQISLEMIEKIKKYEKIF